MHDLSFIAVSIGNTRTQIGTFRGGELVAAEVCALANDDLAALSARVMQVHAALDNERAPLVVASVNAKVAGELISGLADQQKFDLYRIGEDLPIPLTIQLDPETITGVDRLLNAVAAFEKLEQACVIVDAGTAMTVDFIDGKGTFQGGAIIPGAAMQLQALHDSTSALPELEFKSPDQDEPFGKSTAQAMQQGVFYGLRGAVWKLTERYAEAYGAYPQVIATGGDAATLFEDDALVDQVVPHLTLLGMATCIEAALHTSEEREDEPD